MIILKNTTDKLEIILNAAHTTSPLNCYVSWRDRTSTTFIADRTVSNTDGTTPVDISGSPGASTQRLIDFISVVNTDTATKVVTVRYNDNGTSYILYSVALSAGERLEYVEGKGWSVSTAAGAVKQSINQGNNTISSGVSKVVLGSDVTNNNGVANTIADITGLSFPVVAGIRYRFKFVIDYTAAAATTGSRWSINGPAAPTRLNYGSEYSLTTTSKTFNTGLTTYDLPAASNASSASTGGNIAIIEGFITPTNNGVVIARFASEILSSAIVAKAGSYVEYEQVI